MILVCRVILQDHVVVWSCGFMGSSPSKLANILPSLAVIETAVVDIYWFSLSRDLARTHDGRVM